MIVKKCCGVHTLRKVVGIAMLALLLAGSANAANLTVCPIGCEYSSIQKAINASSNGDTIQVQSGTYFEKVKINKKLTLRGVGNPVVDAAGIGSAITLCANGITLEGFTAAGSGYPHGYGIYLYSSSNNTIYNNIFNNTKNFEFQEKNITHGTLKNNQALTSSEAHSLAAISGDILTAQDLARPARM